MMVSGENLISNRSDLNESMHQAEVMIRISCFTSGISGGGKSSDACFFSIVGSGKVSQGCLHIKRQPSL